MIVKTWRDPYDTGISLTRPKSIELIPGITVFCGCNGAGKSTLIQNILSESKINKIPCVLYDNMNRPDLMGEILAGWNISDEDKSDAIAIFSASEGEAIKISISHLSKLYAEFVKSGLYKDSTYKLSKIFSGKEEDDDIEDNRRILLYDATDSGLSIDSVLELKSVFNIILDLSKQLELETYIIVAANEYEMCNKEKCFDVTTGKYITFSNYDEYRSFIIASREKKEKRLARERVNAEKKRIKLEQERTKLENELKELESKEDLTRTDKRRIDDIKYTLRRLRDR